jgi:transposase InsO family protein
VSETYEFIDGQRCAYPVVKMCRWLNVSRSGYDGWRDRRVSATVERREALKVDITAIFEASDGTYGHRRVHAHLARHGTHAGVELVRELMGELGLVACQPKSHRPAVTRQAGAHETIRDLVGRWFAADAPGQLLVGDITYIPTWQGWLYLATVIDCATTAVVGYATAQHCKTSLVVAAIEAAVRNVALRPDAVCHWPPRGGTAPRAAAAATQ